MALDLSDLLSAPPGPTGHNGDCCWVQRAAQEKGATVAAQIRALLAMPKEQWPHKALAAALVDRGINVEHQAIYRHRTQICTCCRVHGATA